MARQFLAGPRRLLRLRVPAGIDCKPGAQGDEARLVRLTPLVIESDPSAAEEGVLSRMLLSPWGSLAFAVGHEVRVVDAGLGSLAESPWPCGSGNSQNNPARI